MTNAVETVQRQLVDTGDKRLLRCVGMGVEVVMLVLVDGTIERQPLDLAVVDELDPVDVDATVRHGAAEVPEPIGGVVRRHAGVHSIVPPVHTTDQVRAVDLPVGQQCAAVAAAARQHAVLIVPPHHHQIHPIDERCGRLPVAELIPVDHPHRVDQCCRLADGEPRRFLHGDIVSSKGRTFQKIRNPAPSGTIEPS